MSMMFFKLLILDNMIKVGKRICNKLNKLIPCKTQEDIDNLKSILEDIFEHDDNDLYYNQIYWDRELYIDCGCNFDNCKKMLIYSDKLMFEPSEDPKYHPGIDICGMKNIHLYQKIFKNKQTF